ncbi:MAG TPA: DNA polymerase domain-containing protein, partial [Anaerolineaceae bacterium]|nr:DNA polymerase domain-containing protein [Anaerolineaceae bacterium]
MTVELTGWLLDLYADSQKDICLWLVGENGERYPLRQAFPVTFYAAGDPAQLRQLWQFLSQQPVPVELNRQQRRDLFQAEPLPVLACQVAHPAAQARLFRQVSERFPDLTYYDADLNLTLRHAARYGTFPLARCRVQADETGRVSAIEVLDSPWELDPALPALRPYEAETGRPQLRIWEMSPEGEPDRSQPAALRIRFELAGERIQRFDLRLALGDMRQAIQTLNWWLSRYDPDLILTDWGDTWMLPMLIEQAAQLRLPLNLSRDPERTTAFRDERSYFSYGRIVYRGGQVTLFGRWHIDRHNAMMWSDYALDGVLENARVTALPVQEAARLSPGTGISAMQIRNALEHDILVPWRKQQVEQEKSALDLIHADMGGLVYQPTTGVHGPVGALDFISMYPSIMVRGSISPEMIDNDPLEAPPDPEGLIPRTLAPLLNKRVALKTRLVERPLASQRQSDKARSSALKWLLVVCFGYLGFKNARFGRIEAHEAVTRYGREALL